MPPSNYQIARARRDAERAELIDALEAAFVELLHCGSPLTEAVEEAVASQNLTRMRAAVLAITRRRSIEDAEDAVGR